MPEIVVDTKAVEQMGKDLDRAKRALIGRLGERGYQLLSQEVPVRTGNLKRGVKRPEYDFEALEATIGVAAERGELGAGEAQVINAKGEKTGTVSLRAQPAYNYAEVVARGNRKATLNPKTAKAFLIPVPVAPIDEGYLLAGGQIFVVRKSRKGQKANPYDERAARRLEREAPGIGRKVLEQFV